MKSFSRVLRMSARMRLTVAGIFVCSSIVGILWGANIGAIYPVVEIIFQGQSMHDWSDRQLKQSRQRSKEIRDQIAQLTADEQANSAKSEQDERQIKKLEVLRSQLAAEQSAIANVEWISPYIERYLPDDAFRTLIIVVGMLMVAGAVKACAHVANAILVTRLSESTKKQLRIQCYNKLLETDLPTLSNNASGKLLSRVTNEVDKAINGVGVLFGKTLREPFKLMVCLAGAAWISWRLLLLALIVTPLAMVLTGLIAKSIRRASGRFLQQTSEMYCLIGESLTSMPVIKAFTMEEYERQRFRDASERLYRRAMRVALYGSLISPNNELLGIGVIASGILSAGYLVLSQETQLFGIQMLDRPLSISGVMAFFAFLAGASDPARKLSGVFSTIQSSLEASDRVFRVLDAQPSVSDPANPQPIRDCGDIHFDDVSFHYHPDQPVLKHIDLQIRRGETLAIVGPNGSGKTTLINLILRFYDPVSGDVRLGDVSLRDCRQQDLRAHIGMVTQNSLLFNDTVKNNIRYGSLDATDEQVVNAAKLARAHEFILNDLSDGYETVVGERGGRLSGGQRQRVELARAILRDPEIMILDEATSQVDVESEQQIHRALASFIRDRTTIMITHRTSTLALADRIAVMNAGQLEAIGTHEELAEQSEVYHDLFRADFRQSA